MDGTGRDACPTAAAIPRRSLSSVAAGVPARYHPRMDWQVLTQVPEGLPSGPAVFRAPLPDHLAGSEALRAWLHADERDRLERFKAEAAAVQFLHARALLRAVLCAALARPNAELVLHYAPNGKPFLPGGPPFSLTHTPGWAGLALAPEGEVGVDFEAHDPARDFPLIARRAFSADERAAIDALPDPDARRAAFYATWTAKEACLKADGRGITADLQAFTVPLAAPGMLTTTNLPGRWHIYRLPMSHGSSAAFAHHTEKPHAAPPTLHDLPPRLLLPACARDER